MNYASITALMAVESSFIPFPSEVVIPPAAFVAGQPDSVLCTTGNYPVDVLLIILFGTLGAMIGAIINYGLSVWLGRIVIYKFADSRLGHMCLLSSEKIQRAEAYFREKGNVSTFVGRFIPGIRQLISIPAGLSRMNLLSFSFFTTLGALAWNCVLALLGWLAYKAADPTVIEQYSRQLSIIIVAVFVAVILFFVVRYIIKKNRKTA